MIQVDLFWTIFGALTYGFLGCLVLFVFISLFMEFLDYYENYRNDSED